jgi:hypothetical protein
MQTDSPFGYGDEVRETFVLTPGNLSAIIEDENDEQGLSYPDVTVKCEERGDLVLSNNATGCAFTVRGCNIGEVVTQLGQQKIISSQMYAENLLDMTGSSDYLPNTALPFNGIIYSIDTNGVIMLCEES